MPTDDLRTLLDSWTLHLRAERKSKETIKSYRAGVAQFLAWCAAQGVAPALTRPVVNAFIAHLVDLGREGATVRARQLAVRAFSGWLADEGEIDRDELLGLKYPKVDQKAVDPFTDDELKALFAACRGREFRDRRDEALFRLLAETLLRANEAISMTVGQTSVPRGHVFVQRGKGGKGRSVFFGAETARAMDRYLRARRTHRLAGTDVFWLGGGGKTFSYYALWEAVRYRAERAGVADAHPHRFRHTGATRWLRKGGSEGGLMAVAGWARRDMIDRYTAATASERAAEEARSLGLGDL